VREYEEEERDGGWCEEKEERDKRMKKHLKKQKKCKKKNSNMWHS